MKVSMRAIAGLHNFYDMLENAKSCKKLQRGVIGLWMQKSNPYLLESKIRMALQGEGHRIALQLLHTDHNQ